MYNKNINRGNIVTKFKLWISDIDGTLMNYDSSYTPQMDELIKKINKSNTKLVLATGRMFMGAQFVADKFNIKTPVVCYQGAVVRTKDEILWQSLIDNELGKEIISYLREKKVHTHIYTNDILYIEDDNKEIMNQYCNGRGTTYTYVKSFDEVNINGFAKILGVINDKKIMQEVKQDLIKKYSDVLTIVQSSPIYLEINNKNASKGNALKFLKEYWNLADDEVIASGDQDNDVDMILNAGVGICVGKNSKELYKVSKYHCKSVDSNELVDIIESLVLCE